MGSGFGLQLLILLLFLICGACTGPVGVGPCKSPVGLDEFAPRDFGVHKEMCGSPR